MFLQPPKIGALKKAADKTGNKIKWKQIDNEIRPLQGYEEKLSSWNVSLGSLTQVL